MHNIVARPTLRVNNVSTNGKWYYIDKQTLLGDLFYYLKINNYKIIAPVKEVNGYMLKPVSSPENIVLDYIRTINGPKHFLIPNKEVLLKWYRNGGRIVFDKQEVSEKLAFFLIKPCDANAIILLDATMKDTPMDPYYSARRENSIVIILDCKDADEYCFCESMNTRIPWENSGDLWLVPIGDNDFAAKPLSDKGLKLVKELGLLPTTKPDIRTGMTKKRLPELDVDELYKLYDSNKWMELSEKCLLCGGCMAACPTCTCFDIIDELSPEGNSGHRLRVWDSCIFRSFTIVAGGRIVRKDPIDRFKHRYYHKFQYFVKRWNVYGCTGCGKCAQQCPMHIHPVDILSEVIGNE